MATCVLHLLSPRYFSLHSGYLCAARDGLSEAELEDLLSLDDEVHVTCYGFKISIDILIAGSFFHSLFAEDLV